MKYTKDKKLRTRVKNRKCNSIVILKDKNKKSGYSIITGCKNITVRKNDGKEDDDLPLPQTTTPCLRVPIRHKTHKFGHYLKNSAFNKKMRRVGLKKK